MNLGTLPNEGSNLQKDMGVALVGVNSAGELILETSKASLNGIAGTGLRGIAGTGLRSDPDC